MVIPPTIENFIFHFKQCTQLTYPRWFGEWIQKIYSLLLLLLILLSGTFSVLAQDTFNYQKYVQRIEQKWAEEEQRRFEDFFTQQQAQFEAFASEDTRAYQQFIKEVETKWNQFLAPSRTQYVEYSESKETRVTVQFGDEQKTASRIEDKITSLEPGKIRFETLVPADAIDHIGIATNNILDQAELMFKPAKQASDSFLDGLVQKIDGQKISLENFAQFFELEVFPKIKVNSKKLPSSDGVERVKVIADVKMAPNIWRIQAEKYLPLVRRFGQKYQVDQQLILAIIETESSFNPKAKSHIPAYGLMQIVPKYAGRDAYRYIYKKDKKPSPRFLYQPQNNIDFGTAYLRILKENYFYELDNLEIQEYMVIAAYNGGMGLVIKKVLKKYDVPRMSPKQVFQTLIREMPDETKGYLRKVTTRKNKYHQLISIKDKSIPK